MARGIRPPLWSPVTCGPPASPALPRPAPPGPAHPARVISAVTATNPALDIVVIPNSGPADQARIADQRPGRGRTPFRIGKRPACGPPEPAPYSDGIRDARGRAHQA